MSTPPKATALASTGRTGKGLTALTPVLLGFEVTGVDKRRPADLITGSVAVGAVVNPALDALLLRSGATPVAENRYRIPLKATGLPEVLSALVPTALVLVQDLKADKEGGLRRAPGAAARVQEALSGAKTAKALAASRLDLSSTKSRDRARGVHVALDLKSTFLEITFCTSGFGAKTTLDHAALDRLGLRGSSPMSQMEVVAGVKVAQDTTGTGIQTVDLSSGASIADLVDLSEGTLLVTSEPGAPGLCRVHDPELGNEETVVMEASRGLAVVGVQDSVVPVAVEDRVIEIAEMALSAPAGREGLHDYQDHYCSVHLASRTGLVNSLAPGMGKTVCVLSAWREAATGRGDWSAVVAAPAGLRSQWSSEAARFFPEASVYVVTKAADIPHALQATGTKIVVLSHEAVSLNLDTLLEVEWDEMACDEAAVLRGKSKRSAALWKLRSRAGRAVALTGTPDERGAVDLADLVTWSRGEAVHTDADTTVGDVSRLCGPTIFSLPAKEVSDQLPEVSVIRAPLPDQHPDLLAAEKVLEFELDRLDQFTESGEKREAAQVRVQLTRHLGNVRAAAGRGAKAEYAVALAENGGQVLVFTDFPEVAREVLATAQGRVSAGSILGGQNNLERTAAAAAFVNGDTQLLCVSGAGHRGLNLQVATDVVHADLPLRASSLVQRTARAVRLGGTRSSINVHVPYVQGTADERLSEVFAPVYSDLVSLEQENTTTVDLYTPSGMRSILR